MYLFVMQLAGADSVSQRLTQTLTARLTQPAAPAQHTSTRAREHTHARMHVHAHDVVDVQEYKSTPKSNIQLYENE